MSRSWICLSVLLALQLAVAVHGQASNATDNRQKKFLSVFQVVTFPNSECVGSGTKNGTCYTTNECTAKGGANIGTCANGFGICCSFSLGCGGRSSQNGTYFDSTGGETGGCAASVCALDNNICQLRLDLTSFVITGPSASTTVNTLLINGQVGIAGTPASFASQCLTDSFSVTGAANTNTPVICGTNSGQHMYVDINSDTCVNLAFQLGTTGVGTTVVNRQWSIKVSQYRCDYSNLAPSGCTQYFFATSGTGTVQTFNFDGRRHLANQNQEICIRRERGNCRICWAATSPSDFSVSGASIAGMVTGKVNSCCTYSKTGKATNQAYDCVSIPGAVISTKAPSTATKKYDFFCGRGIGLVTAAGAAPSISLTAITPLAKTLCSSRVPFRIAFRSDGYEFAMESMATTVDVGARLYYKQDATKC